jgi:ABC-type arginine/histidine transport system permease subunit
VPLGHEAANAIGMRRQRIWSRIILPEAFFVSLRR